MAHVDPGFALTAGDRLDAANRPAVSTVAAAMAALLSMLLFLLLNPFVAVFVLAIVALFQRIPAWSFIVPAAFSFALFFYSREYGIEWYGGISTDDIPAYISMYNSNYGLSFSDLIVRFVDVPNGNELFWHLPWWVLINWLDASENTFLFLHYLLIFFALFLALRSLSDRHLVPFALVYFFLIPISVDGLAHIWRQQLASLVFLAGAGLYVVQGRKIGKWIVYLSPLIHLSNLCFVAVFVVYQVMRSRRALESKPKILVALALLLLFVPLLASAAVNFLDSIGISRILSYLEGYGVDRVRVYLLMGAYAIPQIAAFCLLRNDDLNRLFLFLSFSVFSIVLALPGANGIYDRLLMFTLPLVALYLYRCLLANFAAVWRVPALMAVFLVGAYRLHAPVAVGDGPGSYLAFGHAFDPLMGLLKMLTSLERVT